MTHPHSIGSALLCRTLVVMLALLGACAATACTDPGPPGTEMVTVKGKTFHVDPALDAASREKGLGGVTDIPADGGMLFVFTSTRPLYFVMRDCTIPIDVAFLSEAGTVLSWHAMVPEEPQRDGEDAMAYELRLKRYGSGFPARYALEVAGGTFRELGLQVGDQVDFDIKALKARAR